MGCRCSKSGALPGPDVSSESMTRQYWRPICPPPQRPTAITCKKARNAVNNESSPKDVDTSAPSDGVSISKDSETPVSEIQQKFCLVPTAADIEGRTSSQASGGGPVEFQSLNSIDIDNLHHKSVTMVETQSQKVVSLDIDEMIRNLANATDCSISDAKAVLHMCNLKWDEAFAIISESKEVSAENISMKKTSIQMKSSDAEKIPELYQSLPGTFQIYSEKMKGLNEDMLRQFANYRSIIKDQQLIVPKHLNLNDAFSEIILESSVVVGAIGQILMLPWNENADVDIKSNFWIDEPPPAVASLLAFKKNRKRTRPDFRSEVSHERPMWAATDADQLFGNNIFTKTGNDNQLPNNYKATNAQKSSKVAYNHFDRQNDYSGADVSATYCPLPSKSRRQTKKIDHRSKTGQFPSSTPNTHNYFQHEHPSVICRSNCLTVPFSIFENTPSPFQPTSAAFDSPGLYVEGWSLDDGKWTDPDGYISLSLKQRQKFHSWKRITDVATEEGFAPCVISAAPRSSVIRQGFVGDCSFLSSLAVLAEFEHTHGTPVISGIIYPQSTSPFTAGLKMCPQINYRGLYACRLFFNGVPRKVTIDDFVPTRRDSKLLAAHSAKKEEFWITLLEKSFVKLMGGSYFMQGSNPGADLYHLTGWIPETIPFRMDVHTGSPDTHKPIITGGADSSLQAQDPLWDQVWFQLHTGCVACLGTSEVVDAAPSGLDYPEGVSQSSGENRLHDCWYDDSGIVARHAYSVIGIEEIEGKQLLYIKNPWCCIRWRGSFSPYDKDSWTNWWQQKLNYDQKERAEIDDGYFWIEWSDVIKWFSHLYISWNDSCFRFQNEIHSKWDKTTHVINSILPDDSHLVAFNPQFLLKIGDQNIIHPFEVWVLLSRHVRERTRDLSQKYLAVHVHAANERVACPLPPARQGVYSNGECTLLKLIIDNSIKTTTSLSSSNNTSPEGCCPTLTVLNNEDHVLVVSQYSQKDEFNFTLKIFSHVEISIIELPPFLNPNESWISRYLKGSWNEETAGGCSNDLWSYFRNPHFRLFLRYQCDIKIFLECPQEHSVNIRIFKGSSATSRILRSGKAITSGPYRTGCCTIITSLEAGVYTIVTSAFRPGDTGDFQICLHAGNFKDKLITMEYPCPQFEKIKENIIVQSLPWPYAAPNQFIQQKFYIKRNLTGGGFRGVFQIKISPKTKAEYINISVKTKVHELVPYDAVPSLRLFRRKSLSGDQLLEIGRSDLEGGQSFPSRSISSAAQDFYRKHKIATLSHAILNANVVGPFYIVVSPMWALSSNDAPGGVPTLVAIDSPLAPSPCRLEETQGSFTLHLISDGELEIVSQ